MSMVGRLEPSYDESSTAGPLQGKVNSPDFTDWQNIDWSALTAPAETASPLDEFMVSPIDGSSGLFESGNGFVSLFREILALDYSMLADGC